jgi:hypothetical protein
VAVVARVRCEAAEFAGGSGYAAARGGGLAGAA